MAWNLTKLTIELFSCTALSITPEISPDGSQLYIAGASNDFYCMGSDNGRLLWSTSIDSAILNRPTVFSNTNVANVIYFIESMDGRVRQFDIDTASENWQFSCVDVTGLDSCQNSVEAEFRYVSIVLCGTVSLNGSLPLNFSYSHCSVSESGNVLYYGDIFGRISALEVGTFDTEAPTARPSLSPTVTPSAAPNLSASPTKTNAAMVTTVPTALPTAISTAPPTLLPVVILGPSVFDNANSALGAENEDDEKTDALSLGLIVGVAVAGIIVALLVVFFVARILLRPKKKLRTKETRVKIDDLDGDVEADLESSGEDDSDGADSDDMDDITVTSGSDSVEVEVSAGSQPFQTPIKKSRSRKKRKKIRTPPTATTLASIQEAEDEEIAALPHEDDPKADLSEKFRLVQNTITPVEKGNAGRCSDGHVELAVGLNNLRPLADDMSAGSDDDSVPPPPPPGLEGLFHDHSDIEEEKKDVDFIDGEYLGNLSPQPSFGMTTDSQPPHSPTQSTASARSFISSVAAALSRSPKNSNEPPALSPASSAASTTDQASSEANAEGAPSISMSPSMMSTDSSLYTDDKSRVSTDKLSPLSTGIFGGNDQASLPDDEASAMLQPTLYHKYKARDEAALPARVPGAHYLTKGSPLRPKFTPSGSTKVPKVKSARTKRNLNGFSSSFLQSEGSADEDGNEARISSKAHAEDPRRAPTFKRRSKREETAPKASNMIEDTWNSFLNDLAVAEQQFFSPTHSQKSAVLRYSVDDDDTTLSAPIDDDAATVRTGSA